MKRETIIATAVLFAAIVAVAIAAAPTATIKDVTGSSITLGSLKCGTAYEVQLRVRGANGALSDALTLEQQTKPCPLPAPSADFSITREPAQRTVATVFTSTGTCAAVPCTYHWFHGDAASTEEIDVGAVQPNLDAAFTYVGPVGVRTITLKVADRQGRQSSRTRTFQLVQPAPAPTPGPSPTATPTSTPTLGYPDASNTGVPAGTTLTPSGSLTLNTAGAVIDGRDINGNVVVNAPNVTIRNSRIHSSGSFWLVFSNSTGLVIEDSEIDGQGSNNNGVGGGGYTLRRDDIQGLENGMDMDSAGNVLVEDTWIHDLTTANGAHTDGIQVSQGAHDVVIRHNTVDPIAGNTGGTSAIIMWNEGNSQNTCVWVEDNRLDGTGAARALYCPRQPASAIYINNNRIRRGVYGAYTDSCSVPTTVTEFNGNVDDVTGAQIGPGD